jgi:hypothetical protein
LACAGIFLVDDARNAQIGLQATIPLMPGAAKGLDAQHRKIIFNQQKN